MSLSRFTGEIRDDVSKSEDTVSRSLGVETHVLFRSRFHGIHGARTLYTTHGRKGREREVEKKRVMYEEDICDQKIYSFTGEVCMYVSNSCDEDGSMYKFRTRSILILMSER